MINSLSHSKFVVFLDVLHKMISLFNYTYNSQHEYIEKIYTDCTQILHDVPAFLAEVKNGLSDSTGNLKILEYSQQLFVIETGSRHKHAQISELGTGSAPDDNTQSKNYAGLLEVYDASIQFVELIQELCPLNVQDSTIMSSNISTEAFIMFLFQKCADFQVFTDHKEHYDKDQKVKKTRPNNRQIDLSAAFATSESAAAGDAGAAVGLLPLAEDVGQTKPKRQKVQMRKPVTDVSTDGL